MIKTWVITFATGLLLGYMIAFIQIVHGQTNITPVLPTSGVQFVPQQGYIVTIPPPNVQPPQSATDNGTTPVILSLVTSAGAYIAAKMNADKKHKENASEILKGKEVNKELARVTYDMNPQEAAKIENSPTVKIETLTNDASQYADKVAKK